MFGVEVREYDSINKVGQNCIFHHCAYSTSHTVHFLRTIIHFIIRSWWGSASTYSWTFREANSVVLENVASSPMTTDRKKSSFLWQQSINHLYKLRPSLKSCEKADVWHACDKEIFDDPSVLPYWMLIMMAIQLYCALHWYLQDAPLIDSTLNQRFPPIFLYVFFPTYPCFDFGLYHLAQTFKRLTKQS